MTPPTRLESALAELVAALLEAARTEQSPVDHGPDRLLSIEEAAAILGVKRTSVYRVIGAGELRSVKVGRRRLVPSSAVDEFVGDRS